VNCTLTLLKSTIRVKPTLRNGKYGRTLDEEDDRFLDYFGPTQSVVTSSAVNDAGMFQPGLQDERFLPFEGAGVESRWRLELPSGCRQFDYTTISDAILHIQYTCRSGAPREAVEEHINGLLELVESARLALLFSLRHDFANDWQREPTATEVEISVRRDHFPYCVQDREIKIAGIGLYRIRNKALDRVEVSDISYGELTDSLNDPSERAFTVTLPRGGVAPSDRAADLFVSISYSLASA
jgi:hypothetical protein